MNNPTPRDTAFSPLPCHGVIALHGIDAGAFAQAQWMNDVGAIAPGTWQWNGWLTPKGRVIALFALLQLDSETLWVVSQDSNAQLLAGGLRRYVFRSKVQITVRDDVRVVGAFERPAVAAGNRLQVDAAGTVELDLGGEGGARCLRLMTRAASERADVDSATDGDDPAFAAQWRAFDLAHGLPHLADGPAELWTPQQLSLQRLRAYSVSKGCYPGQEIVARTHFLGQAKRGLARLRSDHAVTAGTEVTQDGRAIGAIASTAQCSSDGGHEVLAVLPLATPADAPLEAAGGRLERAPLLDGLAR